MLAGKGFVRGGFGVIQAGEGEIATRWRQGTSRVGQDF